LIGDGPRRAKLELMACRAGTVGVLPRLDDRHEVARLMASADALVHGCEAETFCLVAAEARASGTPMIIPDRGAALDLLAPHAGEAYRAGNERSLESAIARFVEGGVELQRAAAVRASSLRSMDQHFADLFAHYGAVGLRAFRPAAGGVTVDTALVPELALARSAVTRS
jgi:alpha-1,6-mannosyltransferase